ncbi:MAG: hypothetical protein WBQ08_18790 [Candidatus Sulfotelmatobacter sp.]
MSKIAPDVSCQRVQIESRGIGSCAKDGGATNPCGDGRLARPAEAKQGGMFPTDQATTIAPESTINDRIRWRYRIAHA